MTDLTQRDPVSRFQRILPGLTLMFLAPFIAEVLPGATRVSSLFVLPIEIAIWGGGAVLIREAVRRLKLGWLNLLLLAVALSLAEECLIQQTSLAPLVIKLKGEEYARAFGINYVYLLWAIIYESTFVVFVPIGLAELIFNRRREQSWLSTAGITTICLLFIPACFLAWFTWTHIARTKVFHLDAYNPPTSQIAAAGLTIAILIALAVGPLRMGPPRSPRAIRAPHPVVLFILSGIAVSVLFGLLILAFGISPSFPPSAAVAIGIALAVALVVFLPCFYANPSWNVWHHVGILYGAIISNMIVFFLGFIGASPLDFFGKVILDAIAIALLIWLAIRLRVLNSHATT